MNNELWTIALGHFINENSIEYYGMGILNRCKETQVL